MIRNPQALFSNLAQQHTKYAATTMAANGWTTAIVRTMSDDEARLVCEAVQEAVFKRWGHKAYTSQAITKSLVEAYGSAEAAYEAAKDKVNVWKGTTYEANVDGKRVRKPLDEQHADFKDALRRAERFLKTGSEEAEVKPGIPATIEVKPVVSDLRSATMQLIQWAAGVREWQPKNGKEPWGYRQVKKGVALLSVGFPLEGVKDAFLIDYDPEARRFFGAKEFDVVAWGKTIAAEGESGLKAALRRLSSAPGVNVATVGAAGIGKTHTTTEIMREDFDHHVVVSCNPKTAGADFYGFLTPMLEFSEVEKGFRLSSFAKALRMAEAGKRVAILLDEMDAMESGTAIALNRALEQRAMEHRYLGKEISFLDNIVFYGAMNTVGNGATAHYGSRERQDGAFLDRFVRVRVGFDAAVEMSIAESMLASLGA